MPNEQQLANEVEEIRRAIASISTPEISKQRRVNPTLATTIEAIDRLVHVIGHMLPVPNNPPLPPDRELGLKRKQKSQDKFNAARTAPRYYQTLPAVPLAKPPAPAKSAAPAAAQAATTPPPESAADADEAEAE
jgi:hypothetical protein